MAIETLECLPAEFRAGDTVLLTRAGGDFPATDWPARYIVFQKGATRYRIVGAADDDDFNFEIKSDASKNWEPGPYAWVEVAQNGSGQRAELAYGNVFVGENLIDGSPKTHARKVLENLQAKLESRALPNNDIESSNINGQQIIRMTTDQLVKLITFYESKVIAEDRRNSAQSRTPRCRGSFVKLTA